MEKISIQYNDGSVVEVEYKEWSVDNDKILTILNDKKRYYFNIEYIRSIEVVEPE